MAKRLRDVCALPESECPGAPDAASSSALICRRRGDESHFNSRCRFSVRASSRRLLRHEEFENWAVIALGGIPNKVQVGDMGVDGRNFPAFDNSPAIHGWVHGSGMSQVPLGTKEIVCRPCGTDFMLMTFNPAINSWAIFSEDGFSTACRVIAKRLRDVCALPESEPLWRAGRGFVVRLDL
jgi:hypothetical protein